MNRLPSAALAAALLLLTLAPARAADEVQVTFSAEPAKAAPGEVVELRAEVVVAKGWYVYAKAEEMGIRYTASLPAGLEAVGEWSEPKPVMKEIPFMGPNGSSALMGTHKGGPLRFVQKVRVLPSAKGSLAVPLTFNFQVCNDETCLMPKDLGGTATLEIGEPVPTEVEPGEVEPEFGGPGLGGDLLGEFGEDGGEPKEGAKPTVSASIHPAQAKAGEVVELRFDFKVSHPWHVYGLKSPNGQPLALKLTLPPGAEALGPPSEPTPKTEQDEFLGEVASHYGDFRVTQKVRLGSGPQQIQAALSWQACDPNQCIPGSYGATFDPAAGGAAAVSSAQPTASPSDTAAPNTAVTNTTVEPEPTSLLGFLKLGLAAFLFGLSMLVMPCTYPMIPITVSVFSKGAQLSRGQTIVRASVFGLGIVLSFVAVGGVVQLALGGDGQIALSAFATNAWVNLGLGLVFIYFAFSFFGYYELGLPAPLQRLMQVGAGKTDSDGTVPIWSLFLMGLFFVLTSYTCGAPVVVSLFAVGAGAGSVLFATTIFALTVAFPFVLLAMVPNAMRYMPKSGSWFSVFKVVMGLVELGFAVKFLRGVDVQWDSVSFMPREVVLALWVGLSLIAAVYLIGRLPLQFPHDPPLRPVSKQRGFFAAGFFGLALFFGYGYVGELPADVEAFIMEEHDGPEVTFGKLAWKTDLQSLEKAKAKAGKDGRFLLMFTGHLCVNCIKMEKQVLPEPAVEAVIGKVDRIALFVDKGPVEATHAKLLVDKFGSGAIPAYYVVDGEGKVHSKHVGYANQEKFLEFLAEGGIK